ncbi:MAG: CHAD domain-containing protein [Spirochaetales bacterium]|nr:CHAD domain-containing protein [Spirochaetales bacterium]
MKKKQSKTILYKFPDINKRNTFIDILKKEYIIHEKNLEEYQVSLYDTFDWRLFKNNQKLLLMNKTLTLTKLFDSIPLITEPATHHKKIVRYREKSPLLSAILSIIKTRALLRHTSILMKSRILSLQTPESEETMYLEIIELTLLSGLRYHPKAFLLAAIPDTSQQEFKSFFRAIESMCIRKGVKQDLYFHILALSKIKPGNYSGKLNSELLPHMTTETGCRIILGGLLHIIMQNEKGIKKNIDPEFLHDFRVSIRKTRSLLSQVKKVFPKKELTQFRTYFKKLAKLTNEPRDIDVFLIKMKEFSGILPEHIQKGLIPLCTYLRKKQTVSYTQLKKELESEVYKTLLKKWYIFLNTPTKSEVKPSKADISVYKTAQKSIGVQYQYLTFSGLLIHENSPPEALHSLRIECKKLRYLLEFFMSLFPAPIMKKIISGLKLLQDNLGTYQDLQVQQGMLCTAFEDIKKISKPLKETGEALIILTEHLKKEEKEIRVNFDTIFKLFTSDEIRSYFLFICRSDSMNRMPSTGTAEL